MNYYGLIKERNLRGLRSADSSHRPDKPVTIRVFHRKIVAIKISKQLPGIFNNLRISLNSRFLNWNCFHMVSVWERENFFFLCSKIPSNPLKLRAYVKEIQVCYSYVKKSRESPPGILEQWPSLCFVPQNLNHLKVGLWDSLPGEKSSSLEKVLQLLWWHGSHLPL